MFIQHTIQEWARNTKKLFPLSGFFILFLGIVIAPLAAFILGGLDSNTHHQPSVAWILLGLSMMVLIGIAIGIFRFNDNRRITKGLSIFLPIPETI